jgi:hypothetical protein
MEIYANLNPNLQNKKSVATAASSSPKHGIVVRDFYAFLHTCVVVSHQTQLFSSFML